MALNDVKISQLPEQPFEELTDDTIFVTVDSNGLNKQVSLATIKEQTLDTFYSLRPLGEMSLTTLSPAQSFDETAYTVVTAFDKVQYERLVTVDLTTDSIAPQQDGNYRASVDIVAEFDKAASMDFVILVDGVEAEPLGSVQGLGNGKGVYVGGIDIDPLTAGQAIQLGARRGEAGSVDVVFQKVRIILERV